jgi:hypothetical protein
VEIQLFGQRPIVVVGSINTDLVSFTERVPSVGETVIGYKFQIHPSGKGANHAMAIARLGYPVRMIGRLGSGAFGGLLKAHLLGTGSTLRELPPAKERREWPSSKSHAMPALQWAQPSFIQPQIMVQDRYFYDPVAVRYTADRYLDDLDKRYGGIVFTSFELSRRGLPLDEREQSSLSSTGLLSPHENDQFAQKSLHWKEICLFLPIFS